MYFFCLNVVFLLLCVFCLLSMTYVYVFSFNRFNPIFVFKIITVVASYWIRQAVQLLAAFLLPSKYSVFWNVYDCLILWPSVSFLSQAFSKGTWKDRDICLGHLFTYQDFPDGVIGVAYVGNSKIDAVGGICSVSKWIDFISRYFYRYR